MCLCMPMAQELKPSVVFVRHLKHSFLTFCSYQSTDNSVDIFFKIADALALGSTR